MGGNGRIAIAFGKAAMLLILLSLAWRFVAPGYDQLMAATATQVSPKGISISSSDKSIRVQYQLPQMAVPAAVEGHGFTLHWGLILVATVVLMTPGMSARRRLTMLVLAIGLFFAMHILTLVSMAWVIKWALEGTPLPFEVSYMLPAFSISWTLFPALLAGVWCFLYWRPALLKA